jgi:hypothetical protein
LTPAIIHRLELWMHEMCCMLALQMLDLFLLRLELSMPQLQQWCDLKV